MKLTPRRFGLFRPFRLGVLLPALLLAAHTHAQQAPGWWQTRSVLTTNTANDYAALNAGQLKHLAYAAWLEMDGALAGGACFVPAFTNVGNNYAAVNVGQLKEVARPFYDRMGLIGYGPLLPSVSGDNFALANIGQAKQLFRFSPSYDLDGDGLSNADEVSLCDTDPFDADTDDDGLSDGEEVNTYKTNPRSCNTDGDGLEDAREVFPHILEWGTKDYFFWYSNTVEATVPTPVRFGRLIAVSTTRTQAIALRADGTVVCWGCDFAGACQPPANLTNATAVSAGKHFNLALRADGTVVGWGFDSDGQRVPPPGLSSVVAISAGSYHGVAVKADGTVVCWGLGAESLLKPPEGLAGVISIAAGFNHNVALRQDGTVACWGANSFNESWPPPGLCGVTAVAAGNHQSAALLSNGSVACWGITGQDLVPAAATNIVKIAVGSSRVVALCRDGRILSWGNGFATESFWVGADVLDLSCGGTFAMALLASRTNPVNPDSDGDGRPDGTNTTDIAYGPGEFTDSDGDGVTDAREWQAGTNPDLADTDGDGLSDGDEMNDLAVLEWGRTYTDANAVARPALSNVLAVASGKNHVAALLTNRTVVCWGDNTHYQCQTPASATNVVAVCAGDDRTAAVRGDGTVVCWGHGDPVWYNQVPEDVTNIVSLAVGVLHTVALRGDGTVLCWGCGAVTELPPDLTNVVAVAVGSYHSVALKADGQIACWGFPNDFGQTNVPANLTNVIAVAAGRYHTVALTADRRVVCWGDNGCGQTNTPVGLSGVATIGAGAQHSLAYTTNKQIVCWGRGDFGQSQSFPVTKRAKTLCGGETYSVALLGTSAYRSDPLDGLSCPLGYCLVFFDPQGGSVSQGHVAVECGAGYGSLPIPERIGYDFAGWWTEEGEGGSEVTVNTTVSATQAHTLYARWVAKVYTVTFNPWCGVVVPESMEVTFDGTYGTLPVPVRDGYSFEGWWTEPYASGESVDGGTAVSVAADHTLYAGWKSLDPDDQTVEFLYYWAFGLHCKEGFADPATGIIYLTQVIEWSGLEGGNPESTPRDVGPGQTLYYSDPRTSQIVWADTGTGWPRGWPDPFTTVSYPVDSYDDPPNQVEPDQPGTQSVSNTLLDEFTDELLWTIVDEELSGLNGFQPSVDSEIPCGLGELHFTDDHELACKRKGEFKFRFDPPADNATLYWCEQFVPDDNPDDAVYTKKSWTGSGAETPVFYVDPDVSGAFGTYYIYTVDVDLDLDSAEDRLEETRGVAVALHRTDGTANLGSLAVSFSPVRFESPAVRGTLTLEAVSGGDGIRLWKQDDMTESVTLPKTWHLGEQTDPYFERPVHIYVEGVAASAAANNVVLRLKGTLGEAVWEDTVRLSVVDVSLVPDYYRDGVVDDADRARAASREPLLVQAGVTNGIALALGLRPPDLAFGQVRLSVEADSSAGRAEVRDGSGALIADGDTPKIWPLSSSEPASSLPADLAVFGTQVSSVSGDVVLKLEYLSPEGAVISSDRILVTVARMAIVPDYNRDGIIDEADRLRSANNEVFRLWINDDKDVGDVAVDDSDEPGQSNGNYSDVVVNGRCDLLDFFSMHLDIASPLGLFTGYENVSYRLSQADGAVNVVWTELESGHAGLFQKAATDACGLNLNESSYSAHVTNVTASGVTLPPFFLLSIDDNPACGVIQLEGRSPTTEPIVLEIVRNGSAICRVELPLRIASVEQMYDRLSLRDGGSALTAGADVPSDASDCGNFVFVHGYNVNADAARAWGSEVFKRMCQSGMRARYTAVTWDGSESQTHYNETLFPGVGWRTPDYYANVVNAFEAAPRLAAYVHNVLQGTGVKVVAGHSLGNMLVSFAIADHGMSVDKYFMLNAAVAAECYDATLSDSAPLNPMVHDDWEAYDSDTWAANWHALFAVPDGRAGLTWKGRFAAVLPVAYNYFSSGDEVFEILALRTPYPGDGYTRSSPNVAYSVGRYSWQKQEAFKGRTASEDILTSWLTNSDQAGWGFWGEWRMGPPPEGGMDWEKCYTLEQANALTPAEIRAAPVFHHNPPEIMQASISEAQRANLLAYAVPALSAAAGHMAVNIPSQGNEVRNVDMNGMGANGWWRTGHGEDEDLDNLWLHSDMKDAAYYYVHPLFINLVNTGGLK